MSLLCPILHNVSKIWENWLERSFIREYYPKNKLITSELSIITNQACNTACRDIPCGNANSQSPGSGYAVGIPTWNISICCFISFVCEHSIKEFNYFKIESWCCCTIFCCLTLTDTQWEIVKMEYWFIRKEQLSVKDLICGPIVYANWDLLVTR